MPSHDRPGGPMGWDDVRGGTAVAARTAAHSDDAKHRVDESTRTAPRPRLPLLVGAGVVALLLLGGTAVALTRGDGGGDAPATNRPAQPSAETGTSPSTGA